MSSRLRHRIHNSLLFAVCADRIATAVQGVRLPTDPQLDAAMWSVPHTAAGSNISGQLLVVAEHLAQRGGDLEAESLMRGLARYPPEDPHDADSSAAVRSIAIGLLPRFGSMPITRAAHPVAAASADADADPQAHPGAAVTASAVALAVSGLPNASATSERFLATLAVQSPDATLGSHLSVVRTLLRHRASPAEAAATLTSTGALRSALGGVMAFLRHPSHPLTAIRYALALGGSTRTIATVAAALAGARCPQSTPPPPWRTGVDTLRTYAAANALIGFPTTGTQPRRIR